MTAEAALVERLAPLDPTQPAAVLARDWLARNGLPNPRSEAWRATPFRQVVAALSAAEPAHIATLDPDQVDHLAGRHGGIRLVFVNGRFDASLSDSPTDLDGVWCGSTAEMNASERPEVDLVDPVDGFQALNRAAGSDAAVVRIGGGAQPDSVVHIANITTPGSQPEVSHPRAIVDVADNSHLRLIETFGGLDGSATFTNADTTIRVGAGSVLEHTWVQNASAHAVHLGRTRIMLGTGSSVRSTSVTIGAQISRHGLDVIFEGQNARADLDGIYVPTDTQHHNIEVSVDHADSRCTSTQRYSGIVDDHGHGTFGGHVLVRPDTVATDAQQLNRNLVLSPTAQADTRPWLEILADDVRCTHGATVGQLDEDALFYLRSRGIPLPEARSMMIEAFAAEIIDAIEPTSLRELVATALNDRRNDT